MTYDAVTAVSLGQRDHQEDAVAADFSIGNGYGFAVLSDGMGGHAGGDMASKIVVTEVFSELTLQVGDIAAMEAEIAEILASVVQGANACIHAHVAGNPALRGMGATLVAPVFFGNRLYWVSVGDSPLYLYRGGQLQRLNADHSMAPQLDALVRDGRMPAEEAAAHPDRNALISVIMGRAISAVDCPAAALELRRGDLVIAASDGILTLGHEGIAEVLALEAASPSAVIARALLAAVGALGDPDQDNLSMAVIRMHGRGRSA